MRLDPSLVKSADTFALRVEGDSMIEAGILDGDYVLVRPQQSADNGDIVVALLGDVEVTVKRFYRRQTAFACSRKMPVCSPFVFQPCISVAR